MGSPPFKKIEGAPRQPKIPDQQARTPRSGIKTPVHAPRGISLRAQTRSSRPSPAPTRSPPVGEKHAYFTLLIDDLPPFGTVERLPRIFPAFFTGLLTDVSRSQPSFLPISPSPAHQSHIRKTMHLSYPHQVIFEPGSINALLAHYGPTIPRSVYAWDKMPPTTRIKQKRVCASGPSVCPGSACRGPRRRSGLPRQ